MTFDWLEDSLQSKNHRVKPTKSYLIANVIRSKQSIKNRQKIARRKQIKEGSKQVLSAIGYVIECLKKCSTSIRERLRRL